MTTSDPAESPLELSVKDGAAYSVMFGLGETYISPCAVFVDATDAQVGLIGTVPLFLGACCQLLSPAAVERTRRRNPWIVGGAIVQALAWLPMIAAVWAPPELAYPLLFAGFLLYMGSWHFTIPAWTSVMGDLVPPAIRGRYFSKRNAAAMLLQLAATGAAAWALSTFKGHGREAWGFTVIFAGALAARLLSTSFLRRIAEPPLAAPEQEGLSLAQFLSGARTPNFTRFVFFTGSLLAAQYVAAPLFSAYWFNELKYGYVDFGLLVVAITLAQILSFPAWGRIADRYGNKRVLTLTTTGISLHTLGWLVSDRVEWGCVVQMLGGVSWSGFTLAISNFLLDAVPPPLRTRCTAYMNLLNNFGMLIGGLVGSSLVAYAPGHIGPVVFRHAFWSMILLSSALRLTMVLVFLPRVREVRTVPEAGWREVLSLAIRSTETRVYVAPVSQDKGGSSGVS